jgi:NADH:ubiquinone oxidoreductase subunit D
MLQNSKGIKGESYRMIESGRRALGYYIVSDSTTRP